MKIKLIDINNFKDKRGKLSVLENKEYKNFVIKRIYYMYDLNQKFTRGSHAHKKTTQIVICLNGSCKYLLDNGFSKKYCTISSRNRGLVLEKLVWHELVSFTKDCIVLILANKLYDRKDYIESYDKFLKIIKKS